MILDASGQPIPEKPIGQRYAEALARSRRDTLHNLTVAHNNGWTREEFRHWVETGEKPK